MEQEFDISFNANSQNEIEKGEMIVANFFLSIIWSIGAVLKQSSKEKFSAFFTDLCENSLKSYPKLVFIRNTEFIFYFGLLHQKLWH